MSNLSEKAVVSLVINGEQAKKELNDIETALSNAKEELVRLQRAGSDSKSIRKVEKNIASLEKKLQQTQSRTEGVKKALAGMDGMAPRELNRALRLLIGRLGNIQRGTKDWYAHVEAIKILKARIAEFNADLEHTNSLWGRFKQWSMSVWPALDLLQQWGGNVFDIMRSSVDAFASMDQEMANVRKFTGLTAEQVDSLNEEFKKMNTRSSREELNKLAQEAGRLGKTSKDEILGFVRAADQINVALDDIGEGATLQLSKLTGIFGDEALYGTEQALLKVGSVINELSQNCSASAPFLTQFASRMGGVGSQAKMTIPQIMAFGAVLDSNGQAVEASSTALSQVIVRMMQEPAKYAKVAGLDVKKFTDMLKTDVNGALILFLDTLQKAGGMNTLSPMFADMGETGARAIAVLSTLATHIDDVKSQQAEANKAFAEGTSVTKEFEVQNTTVQASLEKAKKAVNELRIELGERLQPLMSHVISSSSALIRALVTLVRFIMENKVEFISLVAGIAAYNIAINFAVLRTKTFIAASQLLNVALTAQRLGIIALTGVWALLRGNVTRATAAFRLFSATIKANPIGLAVGLITTAVTAIGGWINKVNQARKAERELARQRAQQVRDFQKQISDVSKASSEYASSELDRLDRLYNATQDQNKSQKERIAAIKELQRTYPTAFGNLSQEKILAGDAATAYRTLADNIIKAARAKAIADKLKENEKLLLDLEIEREDLEQSISEDSEALEKAMAKRKSIVQKVSDNSKLSLTGPSSHERRQLADTSAAVQNLNDKLDSSAERLEEIILQTDELNKANSKLSKKTGDPSKIAPDIDFSASVDPTNINSGYVSQTKADKERRKAEAEERRAAAKAKKEFKAQLDAYKAQKASADREVLELYKAGSIEYEELLHRRHENELRYYDNSLSHFEKVFSDQKDTYLQDDKDYQNLLLNKEKSDEKYEKTRISLALESINRRKEAEERNVQHMYNIRTNPTLQDEIALQTKLYDIRKQALLDRQALYTAGSKEYADTEYEIKSLEQAKELSMRMLYFERVKTLREEYDKKSATERFALEKATLDTLLKNQILSTEQYAKYLKGLTDKYKTELPGDDNKAWSSKDQAKYDMDTQALQSALNAQLLTQTEFNERMANLDAARREKMLSGLKETGGEWNAMVVDIYTSFSHLLEGFDGSLASTLANIANCTAAVSSAVGAAMQISTEFAKAESEIQLAAVEKRYDREIELAQGNTYKVAKLEKKKEEETAKIKNQASKKQYDMQIIQAIAQSIVAGLNAYSSTMVIPIIGPTLAPAAMAVALAMGATQVALLKKQQQAAEAQGYSKGGFTKPGPVDEPAGIVHAGEWVASQKLLSNPVARPMIEALDRAQRTNTIGSLKSEDVSRSIRANDSLARIAEGDGSAALMVAAIAQNAQVLSALSDRLDEPFVTVNTVTGDHGINHALDEHSRLIRNKSPKSRKRSPKSRKNANNN